MKYNIGDLVSSTPYKELGFVIDSYYGNASNKECVTIDWQYSREVQWSSSTWFHFYTDIFRDVS